jgi:hypothetical protein
VDFKIFQIFNFSASRFRVWIARVVEIEIHLFIGKQIVILSPAAYINLSTIEHIKSHRFTLLTPIFYCFHLLLAAPLPLPTPWLVRLTRSFMSPTCPSSMIVRVNLRQRVMFWRHLLLPMWLLQRWWIRPPLKWSITRRRRWSPRQIARPIIPSVG